MYIMHCLCYEKQKQGVQGRARTGEAGQGTAKQGRAGQNQECNSRAGQGRIKNTTVGQGKADERKSKGKERAGQA
jgi:hypothetical protein